MGEANEEIAPDEQGIAPEVHLNIVGRSIDPETEVKETDQELKETIAKVMKTIGNEKPTIGDIALQINRLYPINPQATEAVRTIRAAEGKPVPLGNYFQPGENYPYAAVCEQKTLLAQAVASQFGLSPDIVNFAFLGQIRNGQNDQQEGLHAALIYEDEKGDKQVADAHKGIVNPYADYWKNFDRPQIFFDNIQVFAPAANSSKKS